MRKYRSAVCCVCKKHYITTNRQSKKSFCSQDCQDYYYKQNFIEKFNKKFYGRFEYLDGYKNSESLFRFTCLKCGTILERSATCVRKGHSNIACCNCVDMQKEEVKKQKEEVKKQQLQKRSLIKKQKEESRKKEREKRLWGTCKECGNIFKGCRPGLAYCSDECKRRHNNRYHEIQRRNKIRENGKIDYSISLKLLAQRDNNICHICGGYVDMTLDTNNEGYGSIDHVLPINKGGTHTWDNIKLAHRRCNTLKSDSLNFNIKEYNYITAAIPHDADFKKAAL